MRNLTIKRIKSFAGSLGKANVYIEDPVASELTIGKVPCRKIGQLKNGEEKTFQIEETAAKVFVIMDRLSKDFCNDFYQLPEGQEDISLSGRNVFNLAVGNPFRFDNNNDAQALANRKRNTKRGPFVMIGAILIGLVIGSYIGYFAVTGFLANKAPKEKTFTYQEKVETNPKITTKLIHKVGINHQMPKQFTVSNRPLHTHTTLSFPHKQIR